jgi:hypothetical protein
MMLDQDARLRIVEDPEDLPRVQPMVDRCHDSPQQAGGKSDSRNAG